MTTVNEIIAKMDSLKPISPVVTRIMQLAGDDDSSMSEVADVVSRDVALTANLLKICNSARFSLPTQVDSVNRAISLLGLKQVIDLVLVKGLGENLADAQAGYSLEKGALWKQSVATALISKSITKERDGSNESLVYTVSLLKDIGKVVIEKYVGRAFQEIKKLVDEKGYTFEMAEKETLGIDHATLGALVAKKWNFSPKMVFMIKNHHLTDKETRKDVDTAVVYLADTVSSLAGNGIGADALSYQLHGEVLEDLGISQDDLQDLMIDYLVCQKQAESLLAAG